MRKNLEDSKMLSRSISILLETYRSGGNVENILDTLKSSLLKIMESETYRKSTMQQHVMMMYGVFFMYLALIVMLGHFLIPMLDEMEKTPVGDNSGVTGLSLMTVASPCDSCSNVLCFGTCGLFKLIAGMFNFGTESLQVYYKSLFFTMVIVQGIFTGIIAGQISSKSWLDGLRHGFIMMFAGAIIILGANAVNLF